MRALATKFLNTLVMHVGKHGVIRMVRTVWIRVEYLDISAKYLG